MHTYFEMTYLSHTESDNDNINHNQIKFITVSKISLQTHIVALLHNQRAHSDPF